MYPVRERKEYKDFSERLWEERFIASQEASTSSETDAFQTGENNNCREDDDNVVGGVTERRTSNSLCRCLLLRRQMK